MLKKDDFTYIGKFLKPHGTKGEISLLCDNYALGDDCDYVAVEIDGILVPFFFEYTKSKNSDTIIAKIERLETSEEVRFLTNREAYIPRDWVEDKENLSWSYFRGFAAEDKSLGNLGEIVDVDDSTINILFVLENYGNEVLVPAREEFIYDIDHENRRIIFDLPEGLVSL